MLSCQNSLNVAGKGELFGDELTNLSAVPNLEVKKNAQRRFAARASVGQVRSRDATTCMIKNIAAEKFHALRQTRAASPSAGRLPLKAISLLAFAGAVPLEGAFMEAVAADSTSLT